VVARGQGRHSAVPAGSPGAEGSTVGAEAAKVGVLGGRGRHGGGGWHQRGSDNNQMKRLEIHRRKEREGRRKKKLGGFYLRVSSLVGAWDQ
jgi:hypothetical protein